MLILTRKRNETVMVGDDIEVMVVEVRRGSVRLGFRAPDDVRIFRREIYEMVQREKEADGVIVCDDCEREDQE